MSHQRATLATSLCLLLSGGFLLAPNGLAEPAGTIAGQGITLNHIRIVVDAAFAAGAAQGQATYCFGDLELDCLYGHVVGVKPPAAGEDAWCLTVELLNPDAPYNAILYARDLSVAGLNGPVDQIDLVLGPGRVTCEMLGPADDFYDLVSGDIAIVA